jgi:uncharacterized membrane protein YkgB
MNRSRGQEQSEETFLDKIAIPLLRLSLGIVYVWFGTLKIFGVSPVSDIVAKTLRPLPENVSVPLMGLWEVTIGIGLLLRMALKAILPLFFLQIAGTFMTFLRAPEEVFQDNNPLLLSKEGEFALKNLVLLSAGLAVATQADD